MKKELKEQIKRDEFARGVDKTLQWAGGHRDELRIAAGAAVVVALAAATLVYFQASRKREAERAFVEALAIYQGTVTSEQPADADPPLGPVFASAEEKHKTAAAAFDGVDRRYGSLPMGERARYYAALCRIELKQYAEAEKALQALAAGMGEAKLEPALARLALAGLYRRQGQVDKAAEAYRGIAGDAGLPLPRDFALMSLGATFEEARRFAEAAAAYKRLTEEFPASVYTAEARRRADYLQTAAQG